MPKPSCSRPAQRLRHSMANTSAQPYRAGMSSSAHAAEQPRPGAPVAGDQAISRARSRPPPPMATRRSGSGRRQPGRRLDQHVHALAGHEPARGHDQRRRLGQAEARAGRGPLARGRAGGTARCRRRAGRRRPAAAGRPPARPRRPGSPRRRRPARRPAAPAPSSRPGERQRARARSPRRRGAPRRRAGRAGGPSSPSGSAGSSRTRPAPTSAARRSMRRASARVGQQHRLAAARSTRNGWSASQAAAPACGVVSTVTLVGGQPPPQLPQVGLDPAELGREVVGDQQVPHDGSSVARRPDRRSAPASTAGVAGMRASTTARARAAPRIGVVREAAAPGGRRARAGGRPRPRGRARAGRRRRARGAAPPRPAGRGDRRRCPAPPGRCGAGTGLGDAAMYQRPCRAISSSSVAASRSRRSTSGSASGAGWCRRPGPVGAAVGRAHLLAVVAAVEPVAERGAVLTGERAVDLHQPRQAPSGVDDAGGDDRAGGTRRPGNGCSCRSHRPVGCRPRPAAHR